MPSYNSTSRVPFKTGGRVGKQIGGRANLLEEVGRIDAERMNPNRRAEKARVIGELNRGFNKGGRVGLKRGGEKSETVKKQVKEGAAKTKKVFKKTAPVVAKIAAAAVSPPIAIITGAKSAYDKYKKYKKDKAKKEVISINKGGRVGLKKGGNGKWIQSATASIKRRGTEGVCTGKKFGGPTCPPGSKRYNLAKTFKAMGKERKKEA
jgi:hypothetical protein